MSSKPSVKVGLEFETVFYANPKKESPFRFRATHIDGSRAPKVILCDDGRIQPGQLCRVRITSVKKPASKEHGHLEVEFLSQVTFRLDDSLYVDPMLAKKLQALLESGMNILLDGPQGSGKLLVLPGDAIALMPRHLKKRLPFAGQHRNDHRLGNDRAEPSTRHGFVDNGVEFGL